MGRGNGRGDGRGGGGGCPITQFVVLMCENRSFDHMCGWLKRLNSEIDGLSGNESNPIDPSNPSSQQIKVSNDAQYVTSPDPGHSVPATTTELWGGGDQSQAPPMNGFVLQYAQEGDGNNGADIMRCFDPSAVPSISSLAMGFAVFDRWFASIPGPTQPNRMYIHSATSHGAATNDDLHIALGYPQPTIYDSIYDAGHSFGLYYSDFPASLIMRSLRQKKYRNSIHQISKFYEDCANGTLPNYSFLEPRWFHFLQWQASDQHPPHNVQLGDFLIADVYEAIRNSPQWESTALLITYDEHGGLFDHVPTPLNGVPNPDGINSSNPPFDFNRLGVRVPAVLVSPWIAPNTVIHSPPTSDQPQSTSQYEHSSVAATMKQLFNLPSFLTQRDAWAATFMDVLNGSKQLDVPRTDCMKRCPRSGSKHFQEQYRTAEATPETLENIQLGMRSGLMSNEPISDLQREILMVAAGLANDTSSAMHVVDNIKTEHEGALFVREKLAQFLQQQQQ